MPRMIVDKELRGPRGIPGVLAIPADEFIAGRIADEDSATYAALTARLAKESGQIGYAENKSGQPTVTLPGQSVHIPGCLLTVPPTYREVWIKAGAMWAVDDPGQGELLLQIWEITGAVASDASVHVTRILTSTPQFVTVSTAHHEWYVGPSDEVRAYMLTVAVTQEESDLTGYVRNLATDNGSSWMAAVAL